MSICADTAFDSAHGGNGVLLAYGEYRAGLRAVKLADRRGQRHAPSDIFKDVITAVDESHSGEIGMNGRSSGAMSAFEDGSDARLAVSSLMTNLHLSETGGCLNLDGEHRRRNLCGRESEV